MIVTETEHQGNGMAKYVASFQADADVPEIAQALIGEGAIAIDSLVPGAIMDEIYEEITAAVAPEDQQGTSQLWPKGNKTVGGLAAVSRTFVESLLVHPKILAIIDAVLQPRQPMAPEKLIENGKLPVSLVPLEDGGSQLVWSEDEAEAYNCHHYTVGACVMLEVGASRDEHQYLHRENAIYQPYVGPLAMREFIVSTMWAGTDFTTENGATRVVPGSHNWPEQRLAKSDEIIQAEMPKGSVVLWLSRTLHGAARSINGERRTGYFTSYIADWFRQEENQYISVPPEVAETYSERARQIIGYCCSDSLGWVKGRDRDNLLRAGHSGQL